MWIGEVKFKFVFHYWPARGTISQAHMSVRKISSLLVSPLCLRIMWESPHNAQKTWDHLYIMREWELGPHFIFFPTDFAFHSCQSYLKSWQLPGPVASTRGNVSLLAVLAIATCLPQSGFSVDEQTEKCVRRYATEKDQRWGLGPSIRNFQWLITGCSHSHFTFQ